MSPQPIKTFKNVNTPIPIKKGKPKIVKIPLTEEDKQDIKTIIEGKPPQKLLERWKREGVSMSNAIKCYHPPGLEGRLESIKKKYFGGLCHICYKFPVYKVLFKMGGVTLVEFYCQEHIDKIT